MGGRPGADDPAVAGEGRDAHSAAVRFRRAYDGGGGGILKESLTGMPVMK